MKSALLIVSLLGLSASVAAQKSSTQRLQEGYALETQRKDSLALMVFESVLQTDPFNADVLVHAGRMHCNLAGRTSHRPVKEDHIQKATSYSMKAMRISPSNKEAHLNYIIALSQASDIAAGASEKLKYARTIKEEADHLIYLDSLYAPAHFALGKWHLSLASLTWLEKISCELIFGGLPEGGTFERALFHFNKAIKLQPKYILFHYNKALALYKSGRENESRAELQYALTLPLSEPDDSIRRIKCLELAQELKETP